ncbi:hypothetical protein [Myxosarcina sp. GI1]|uniref:hypothetical protein n=1 Tax=Myxosarcina sp. GI1 TaxID=1541065 RepID=UPI0005681210|nr:hypothetical protein [Myxosarcina sp. GI1]
MNILNKTVSAAENFADTVTQTTNRQLDTFKTTTNDYMLDKFKSSLDYTINSWFAEHPLILWLVHHPLITVVGMAIATIFMIRLFVAVYKLITTSIDRLWLWILQAPFLLLKKLFGWEVRVKDKNLTKTVTNYELTTNSEQLSAICDRLDLVQKQQQQILAEIARLKAEKPVELEKFKSLPAIDRHI